MIDDRHQTSDIRQQMTNVNLQSTNNEKKYNVNEYRTEIKVDETYFCLRITDTFRMTTKEKRQTRGDKKRMTNDR